MAWTFGKKKASTTSVEDLRARAIAADKAGEFQKAFQIWLDLAEQNDPEAVFYVGERFERGLGTIQNFQDALTFFRKAAELQWEPAYGKLGDIYLNGRASSAKAVEGEEEAGAQDEPAGLFATLAARRAGIRPDLAEAALWNELAAEHGDPKAQVRLAYQFASKLGVPQDFQAAEWWFFQAAQQGDAGGQLGLGMILAAGRGRPKDIPQAIHWLAKAAAQDNANAKACLAVLLMDAENAARDPELALALLGEAAEARLPEAMFLYGEYKRFGVACTPDPSEAETWLRRAALTGHVRAMASAGALLRDRPLPDYQSAAAFFREAADLGHGPAQFALGELYARGLGVPQDGKLAALWFQKAAEQGVVSAYQRLGAMYADGLGLERDFEAAADWFGKAAVAGHKTVHYEMATLHHYGRGVPVDIEKALALYRLASSQGDARASLRLGVLYAEGEVVKQDWQAAAKWYGVAAAQGSADAELNLAFIMIRALAVGTPEMGVELLVENAEAGNPKAIWALYRLYTDDVYLPAIREEADKWLMRAVERAMPAGLLELTRRLRADEPTPISAGKILALLEVAALSGDAASQSALALLLAEGKHVPKDFSGAVTWFTRAANRGDAFAQAWLGDVLATGQGVPKDLEASKAWYRLAANQGHVGALLALTASAQSPGDAPEEDANLFHKWLKLAERGEPLAQRMVGDYLVNGIRCAKSLPEGAAWLRKAAAQGNAASKLILAKLLVNGQVPQDHPNEAAELMHEAASTGDVEASYTLGVCYRLGIGGLRSDKLASIQWYRRAANQNHALAQVDLGDLLLENAGSAEALAEARSWYAAAAKAGNPKASFSLGRMHETGVGMRQNLKHALDFYRQAAEAGYVEAAAAMQRCAAAAQA